MALTLFQRDLCRLLAQRRREGGESYVAGGVALNAALGADRISRDIDLFHDTQSALQATWEDDRQWLAAHDYALDVRRERPSYVEAFVRQGEEGVLVEWVQDSAFRFFPLLEHPDFGLTLHPLDLATNKLLAMVGRLEVRDWIDTLECHRTLQPLGFLAWAACGKDEGLNPLLILGEAARSSHYAHAEVAALQWQGDPPDTPGLAREWKVALREAQDIVAALPLEHLGKCVLDTDVTPFRGTLGEYHAAKSENRILFHAGSIRGAWPQIKTP